MTARPDLRIGFLLISLLLLTGITGNTGLATPKHTSAYSTPGFSDSRESPDSVHVVWEFRRPKRGAETYTPSFNDVETDGRYVFATIDRVLYAVDLLTGDSRWERTFATRIAELSVRPDAVIVAAGETVYALDPDNGRDRWSVMPGGGNLYRLTSDSQTVYASTIEGETTAVKVADGIELWRSRPLEFFYVHQPEAAGGMLILTAYSHTQKSGIVTALDADTGAQLWFNDLGNVDPGNPTLAEGVVYVGVTSRSSTLDATQLFAFSADSGIQRWNVETAGFVSDSPLVRDGIVFITEESRPAGPGDPYRLHLGSIEAATGDLRWSRETDGTSTSGGFRFANNVLLISVLDGNRGRGNVVALDPATGEERWSYQVGNSIAAAPVIAGGLVVVVGEIGNDTAIFALGPGARTVTLGWQLVVWYIALTAAVGLVYLILCRYGGWQILPGISTLKTLWTPIAFSLGLALVIALLFSGTAGFLTAWLSLSIVALGRVIARISPTGRQRYLAGLWFWILLVLVFSVDLTNDRLGPLALFDYPARILALLLLATAGGILLAGWTWPLSVGIGWISAVIGSAMFITFQEGATSYLDAWQMLLVEKMHPGLFSGGATREVLSSLDLATFTLVGASLMVAGGAVSWALGMPPPRQKRWIAASLLAMFVVAAAVGVLTDDALYWSIYVMLAAGFAIGIIVRTKWAFAFTIVFGFAVSIGAAAGILLARGLVHAWEARSCDWITPCSSSEIAGGVIGMVVVSLIPALVGIGIGQAFGRPPDE